MGEIPRVLSVCASSDSAGCVRQGDVLDVSTNTVSTESHMISHMIGQVLESGQRPLLQQHVSSCWYVFFFLFIILILFFRSTLTCQNGDGHNDCTPSPPLPPSVRPTPKPLNTS